MARDGQGLDVSNASAAAIEAIDLLRDEWLAFGKRLPDVVAAAEKEERCALLPLMSANLLLTVNSPAAFDWVVTVAPVSSFDAVTGADGIAAPVGSVMLP